jgi:FkbM family methyltransferase
MQPLLIRIKDFDVRLVVPASLSSITTYVLLEQEAWFEKELSFLARWLKPGMTTIDIGANLGVYALPMARMVGPTGRVFAYEPGSEPRGLLERSRDLNAGSNLQVVGAALSDSRRQGFLRRAGSTELGALGDDGEQVDITSLDDEFGRDRPMSPDFIKIDAEGEEERILAGGREFFARHSALLMVEVKAEGGVHQSLLGVLPRMGYRLFRLLRGAPVLVPFDHHAAFDPFELNLFAAKSDRVASLCAEDVAVDAVVDWQPDARALRRGLNFLGRQKFAAMFGNALRDIDSDYAGALAGYASWRNASLPARTRCAALFFAYRTLAALCNRSPTTARYSTFARIAWEGGWRGESVVALRQMAEYTTRVPFRPVEPCWPANPRFDEIPAADGPVLWFTTAILEQLETAYTLSSYFTGISPWIGWLSQQRLAAREMHRRKVLAEAKRGMNPVIPPVLREPASDHVNADIWRDGKVPGTRVDR